MANHDLILGQNHNLALGQNQPLVLGHDHNLGLTQNHDLELGQTHERHSGLGQDHDHDHDHDLGLGHSHDHDLDLGSHDQEGDVGHSYGHDDDLTTDQKPDHGDHELALAENNELAVAEGQELDDNLELAVDDSQELGIDPARDLQAQMIVSLPPVLQARNINPIPTYELAVGQEFPDVKSCRRALRDTAIALHFEMQTIKSDKTRFTAKCATEGCPWRIHAAKLPGVPTFTIRTIHETHTCGGIAHLGHQQASVQWVANSVEQRLRENPNYKPKEILEEIHRVHGITLSYKQAWRGKERIMAAMRGSFEEAYRLLPQYCEQVKRTNPGSIASVYGNPTDYSFQRLFISFQASIYGFLNACRPLLGLDRTFLKSKYLGTLLLATGFDGDGALFPLAFGVVDEENDDNWMWFLSELHNLLEINTENMPRLTILSDRQKGIVDGVEANFPTAFHGFCMRHLSESFRKEFNNTMLVNLLWEAAHALTVIEFEAKILEIEEISQDAAYWIRRIPPRLWATAYFEGTRFGHLTANIVESLNNWILEASGLPVIQMMECIRRQLMTWFNERRETSMQWTSILVPTAERRVADALERARTYQVLRANEAEFEVISQEGTNIVDIRNRCCLCRGWQLYGLPCAHAVAALLSCRQNVHRFTESCFTVATYRKTYSQTIHPIPDKSLWKELTEGDPNASKALEVLIYPPKSLKPPGRPRKKRVRAEDRGRVKRVVHCSRCNQTVVFVFWFPSISSFSHEQFCGYWIFLKKGNSFVCYIIFWSMAIGGISSVKSEKLSHRFTRALSSAFLEWLLILMLFIDAMISYLITKFAHKCKLQTPCLLCSRLDHVFGKEKLKFYWDLVCCDHKLEISSLVYCHAHNMLVDVHGMCETCLFSFATINKSNAETYRLLVGKLGEHSDFGLHEDPSLEDQKLGHSPVRHCSCCNEPWMPKGYMKTLIQTQSTVSQNAEFDLPSPVSKEQGQDDLKNRSDNASVSVKAKHQRERGPDPLSHVAYTELKIDSESESESEVSSVAGDEEEALILQTDHLHRDIVDQHVQLESHTITVPEDVASDKLIDPVSETKPSISVSQSQADIVEPLVTKSEESIDSSIHGLEELNWKQASSKAEPSEFSDLISLDDDVPVPSNDRATYIDVSTEMNLESPGKVFPLPNADEIPTKGSEDSKNIDHVSSPSPANETPVEVPKESNPISIDYVSPSNFVASPIEESKESSVMSTLEVEKKSVAECEEICKPREQPLPIPESPVETNHASSDTSIQVPNSLDLSDAYKLAVGSRGRQLSGLLVEQWIGKESSKLSEDLKALLSQLSARGFEQSMNDASPRIAVSPRISVNSDEFKASDSSIINGIHLLQKRVSLERNESGLSIDGSIVSEIEGESVVDRLKRQVEHDRKLLNALYKELEEERNASAIAANQAMAMITRLQEEKATLQMEALQNLRIMEEQAEYDMEALQQTNDLLAEKEKEIQELEAELEFYRMKFHNVSMLGDIVKPADDFKARQGTEDHSESNGIEERTDKPPEPVSEKTNISCTVEGTNESSTDSNQSTMKNQLPGYEEGCHE
ncbi:Transposase, MuDR, plant [Corchorus capsularis]|uniref:Transposase, MuDR, plant n=1 Tax=Corchorus capsularis TaxID=210143 RepID=A0A1R3HNQ0_COCAP|nr:Transposase, MuDR, plant [Corchorus capsularis]